MRLKNLGPRNEIKVNIAQYTGDLVNCGWVVLTDLRQNPSLIQEFPKNFPYCLVSMI